MIFGCSYVHRISFVAYKFDQEPNANSQKSSFQSSTSGGFSAKWFRETDPFRIGWGHVQGQRKYEVDGASDSPSEWHREAEPAYARFLGIHMQLLHRFRWWVQIGTNEQRQPVRFRLNYKRYPVQNFTQCKSYHKLFSSPTTDCILGERCDY